MSWAASWTWTCHCCRERPCQQVDHSLEPKSRTVHCRTEISLLSILTHPKTWPTYQYQHQYRTQLLDKVTAIDISVDKYSISLPHCNVHVSDCEGTYQYRLPESVQRQLLSALADLLIVRLCDQRSFKLQHMWGFIIIRIVTWRTTMKTIISRH